MMTLLAKSSLLSRLRLRAWALLMAITLVAGGFLTAAAPLAVAAPPETAAGVGHCADHAAPVIAGATQDRHVTHTPGCCDAMCTCACTHAIASVPLLVVRFAPPLARVSVSGSPPVRFTPAAPLLRPPIA